MAKRGPKQVTQEHKDAMNEGRQRGHIVRNYLAWLEEHKPRRGRRLDIPGTQRKIEMMDAEWERKIDPTSWDKLQYLADRKKLVDQIATAKARQPTEEERKAVEEPFIEIAKAYSEQKGITYDVWLEVGVPRAVLRQAGIRPVRTESD